MLLLDLLRSAGVYYRACGDENINIDQISSDSRSVGEKSLFHTHQEDAGEFQSFGGVHRHQAHFVPCFREIAVGKHRSV